ncbi:hypothetical protein pb186bvf_016081 [Paramecium bursaria]
MYTLNIIRTIDLINSYSNLYINQEQLKKQIQQFRKVYETIFEFISSSGLLMNIFLIIFTNLINLRFISVYIISLVYINEILGKFNINITQIILWDVNKEDCDPIGQTNQINETSENKASMLKYNKLFPDVKQQTYYNQSLRIQLEEEETDQQQTISMKQIISPQNTLYSILNELKVHKSHKCQQENQNHKHKRTGRILKDNFDNIIQQYFQNYSLIEDIILLFYFEEQQEILFICCQNHFFSLNQINYRIYKTVFVYQHQYLYISYFSDRIKVISNQIEQLQKSGISLYDITTLENYAQVSKYNDLCKLDDEIVQQLIRIENYQFNIKFHKEMKDGLNNINKIKNTLINILEKQMIKGLKYELNDFYTTQESEIFSATVSENQKYFSCRGTDSLLRIWNNEGEFQEQFKIQFDSWIFTTRFVKDSSLLYVGTQKGFLYQLNALNNFKIIKGLQVNNDCILNIQLVTNNIILSVSKDKYLQRQILILVNKSLKYSLITIGLMEQVNLLWDPNIGDLMFSVPDSHYNKKQIKQVVLQQHTRRLFSLDNYKNIKVWLIDPNNKSLQLQHSITDENLIFNLSLTLDQKYITIVCRSYIKILDLTGQCIQQINHDMQKFYMFKTVQLDSINRIIIKGTQQLTLCVFGMNNQIYNFFYLNINIVNVGQKIRQLQINIYCINQSRVLIFIFQNILSNISILTLVFDFVVFVDLFRDFSCRLNCMNLSSSQISS